MKIEEILQKTINLNWKDKIQFITSIFQDITFSTSFSIEDQLITDFIAQKKYPITIFAIDTGRLPEETLKVWQETKEKYSVDIKAYYPNQQSLENFVSTKGVNSFYESKELRMSCCNIRKVEPLKRALQGKKIWISGLRKQHSDSRGSKDSFEYDNNLNIIKFYPIIDFDENNVWEYVSNNQVPYSKLYDQGYKSIGCAPCSRAIKEGENSRAGRWWWEEGSKECGLHVVNGKLVPIKNR